MDFTCVNCSKLAAVSFTSDDFVVYRCDSCDMEYRLITGYIVEHSSMIASVQSSKVLDKSEEYSAMPIKVEIKRPWFLDSFTVNDRCTLLKVYLIIVTNPPKCINQLTKVHWSFSKNWLDTTNTQKLIFCSLSI